MDNNDFILKIVAELEEKGIKTGFDKLKKAIEKDPAKIDVILDTSGTLGRTKGSVKKLAAELHNEISVAISKLQKQGQDINFDLSVGDVEEVINNVINHTKKLEQNFDSASAKAQKFLAQFNKKSGGVLINSAEFKAVQEAIDGLGNTHSIEDLNKSMNTLEVTYNNIVSNLRNGGKSLNPFINAINDMKNMDSTLKGIELDYQSLASKPKDVANSIKELYNQQQKVNQYSQGTIEWSQEYGILQSKIVQVKNEIQNVAKAEKASNTDESNRVTYYQRIIDNNKTIYSLKNKLLTADQEQTKEINRQIKALEERNRYNYNQLSKKGLTDNSWEQNINSSKNALENQLRINEAKQNDIAHTREIAQAEKEAANAAKERQSIEAQVNKIQLLSNGGIKNDYATQIAKLEGNFRSLGLKEDEIQKKTSNVTSAFDTLKSRINQSFDESNYQEIISLNDKLQNELIESSNEYTKLQSSTKGFVSMQQRLSKANTIEAWNQKNTAATKAVKAENEAYISSLRDLNTQMSKMQFNQISDGFKKNENSMRAISKLGASLKDQMSQAAQSFTQWLSVSSAVMLVISKTRNAISELKEINTLLTEISKANDKLSKSDLNKIGNNSFDIASKYGKNATDYLSGVQEASRAGYKNAEGIAELSVAAQGAGDMTAELANQYLIATDKAYKFGGSVEKLTEVLDGSNYITNHNAVNMTELAESMSIVGSTAASFGVDVDEATAALGTMIATTQQSGSEVARAFKAILLNVRQVSDEEEGIDAEGLTKYEKACNSLGVKLKETKDGVLSLRDPMEVLKELSIEYNKLDESDIRRTNLLSSVGGKLRATQLDALLRQWDTYEAMLQQYADGTGSMAVEAEKTANSWEGSMNRLGNTWKDTVGNIANSDAIITVINSLNGLLSVINSVTDKLGSLGTIGLGVGLFAGLKNVGKHSKCRSFVNCFE